MSLDYRWEMDRRKFLKTAGVVTTATSIPILAPASEPDPIEIAKRKGLSILQGLTSETTTQLSVDVPRKFDVAYLLTDTETHRRVEVDSLESFHYKDSRSRVDKIKFKDLELGHRYELEVREKKKNRSIDKRVLSTVDLNKAGARIGIMSCMHNFVSGKKEMWATAEAADLDYFFFIGDNVYGDLWKLNGPGMLWSRYLDTREDLPFYRWKNLKPVIATWDDHDFGKNDSDGTYKHKEWSLKIFKAFFAQDDVEGVLESGPGISCYLQAFNQNFAFFDNRFFRALPSASGTPGFLGASQIDFFSTRYSSKTAPTWIIQGAPLFGRPEKGSSYQTQSPDELAYLFEKLKSWSAPTIFAAGDLHFSEISAMDEAHLGYGTFEVISSSMHSFGKKNFYQNPNRHIAGSLDHNFIVIEQLFRGSPIWKATCMTKNNKILFETTLEVG